MIGIFVLHFIVEINDILCQHPFLRTEHGQCGKTVLWNCAAPKRLHSSQSPGTPLIFSRSDGGSNGHLEESKLCCTEVTNSSVNHDLIHFHKP